MAARYEPMGTVAPYKPMERPQRQSLLWYSQQTNLFTFDICG